ncbi:hypothetical protein [Nocardiopsis sp. L17-MgMaSL7]|uniref:hypothetical protein n=1 Tax=Nocardiopsis sp. L17-MgMaSL7 TaxID=1938893 RepID=UPI000D70B026|nr:hypothetical protein [Nocardiopsis sp. L17-MgMaSL7]PWV44464.1 hypothetical protein BDW27_1243 [Nocardiopsis sp. L17-MgMaSL7]
MTPLSFALWGLFGAAAVEGLQLNQGIRKYRHWPWKSSKEPDFGPWCVSAFIRLSIGGGLATAAGLADQVSGPFGALAIGVASPYIIEQLQRSAQQSHAAQEIAQKYDDSIRDLSPGEEEDRAQ